MDSPFIWIAVAVLGLLAAYLFLTPLLILRTRHLEAEIRAERSGGLRLR